MKQGTKIIAPLKGGALSVIDPETGEEIFTVPLAAGVHEAIGFEWITKSGYTIEPAKGTLIVVPATRIHVAECPDQFSTAANPEWVPSIEMRQQQMFEKMLTTAKAEVKRALNKERADARALQRRAALDQAAIDRKAADDAAKAQSEKLIEDIKPDAQQP